jgi:hypothetical protein
MPPSENHSECDARIEALHSECDARIVTLQLEVRRLDTRLIWLNTRLVTLEATVEERNDEPETTLASEDGSPPFRVPSLWSSDIVVSHIFEEHKDDGSPRVSAWDHIMSEDA